MAMDDVAGEIAEIQNCQLSSEVKLMLLNSYSPDDIVLALEINHPTTESQEKAKEGGDALIEDDGIIDESSSLPLPLQPKAKHAVEVEEKPVLLDDHHSKIELEAQQHSNPLQKSKNNDPEENTKMDPDHYKLIDVEETLSQENQQPKENGSGMNSKGKSESVNATATSSEIDDPEVIAVEVCIKASTQLISTESCRCLLEEKKSFLIKELNSNSDGKTDESCSIYPQQAICRHCSILIISEEESEGVLNTKCKCTKTCLLHEGCKDAWSLAKGDNCSYCDQPIHCTRVMVSSTQENNIQISTSTSTTHRSWCCLW